MKKLPWLSASLLFITYANFGWMLVQLNAPNWAWIASVGLILLIAEALASPWSVIRAVVSRGMASDTQTFWVAMLGTCLAVVCLTWVHVSAHGLILITAGVLVRLDAQRLSMKAWQACLLLMVVSLSGLALGWFSHTY
jgi:hypothetical protein